MQVLRNNKKRVLAMAWYYIFDSIVIYFGLHALNKTYTRSDKMNCNTKPNGS
jgi:hypothetical protein